MARFSERVGVKPPKTVLQLNSMDSDLRNGLWNCVVLSLWPYLPKSEHYDSPSYGDIFFKRLWSWHYKQPVDQIPEIMEYRIAELRTQYFKWTWHDVYDFIEFAALVFPQTDASAAFVKHCNAVLEQELSAYRFVKYQLTPITNEQELEAVQRALELRNGLKPVTTHLKAAVELFSDRKSPDYRNSIKESISAVEAICQIITGDDKATLGQALKKLEEKGIQLHEALKKSFSSLYGYTSDADGIRHALLEESTLDFDDAKFMLVSCSAFVNYLAAEANKAGAFPATK
jgi:hypothetical protein